MSLYQQIDAHKVYSGWLYKKGWYNTSWKKRYFVLYDDRTIHYFAKESHAISRTKAKGKIHLTQIRRVELVSYNDPKNKTKPKHKHKHNNISPNPPLYRKTSLPIHLSGSYHPNNKPSTSTPQINSSNHIQKTKSPCHLELSPQILASFSFHELPPPHSSTPQLLRSSKSQPNPLTPTLNKSFNYRQPIQKMQRSSSVHIVSNIPSSPPSSSSGLSALQSINEKESIEAVTSLQPFTMQNDYFSALGPHVSPVISPANGVNGWSFNGMNYYNDMNDISMAGNYYSTPSNIVCRDQPPPDYNDIIKHEKKFEKQREELDKSLLELTQKHKHKDNKMNEKKISKKKKIRKAHKYNNKSNSNNKENKPVAITRPPVPITRRQTRNRTQSASAAQITRDLSSLNYTIFNDKNVTNSTLISPISPISPLQLSNTNSNVSINRRQRSASCVYLRQQPLTLQSSSTTTFQSNVNIIVNKPRSESTVSTSKSSMTETISVSDRSLTPYYINEHSVETVECELSDNEDMLSNKTVRTSEDFSSMNSSLSNSNVSSDYMAGFGMSNKRYNKDVILSTEIRRSHKGSTSLTGEIDGYSAYEISESKKDEFDIFENVMNDTRLGLSCNKRYSFSLIHPNREYILSAENNDELKEWIGIFSKLVQGKPIYSGYLALKHCKKDGIYNKKFFILFENKVLNYYKDRSDVNNGNACEFDIDLRHVMWLRYCSKNEFDINLKQYFGDDEEVNNGNGNKNDRNKSYYLPAQTAYFNTPSGNSVINPMAITNPNRGKNKKKKGSNNVYSLEIAIPNRIFIMTAETQRIRNEWYNQIRSVFPDTLILKRYFDSGVSNIYFGHNQSNFKNRYIALFKDMLVIFQNKKKLDTIKRMTFFDETRFRDYIRKNYCTIIPINKSVKVRRSTNRKHGNFAFVVSNHYDDRKWYFSCVKKEDLDQWIYLLVDKRNCKKRKKSNPKYNRSSSNNLQPPLPKHSKNKKQKIHTNSNKMENKMETKMENKQKIHKSKSYNELVESTLISTNTNKQAELQIQDTTNNTVETPDNSINDIIPDNYDLSLVSSDYKSPITNEYQSPPGIDASVTARYFKIMNISPIAHLNRNNILPYNKNKNKNRHIHLQSHNNKRATEKLIRSYSDDLTDENRQYQYMSNKQRIQTQKPKTKQKKTRSISVDAHDLSPKNKSRININLDKMLNK